MNQPGNNPFENLVKDLNSSADNATAIIAMFTKNMGSLDPNVQEELKKHIPEFNKASAKMADVKTELSKAMDALKNL